MSISSITSQATPQIRKAFKAATAIGGGYKTYRKWALELRLKGLLLLCHLLIHTNYNVQSYVNRRRIWTISKLTYKPILKKICEIPARITPPSSLSLLCFIPTKRYFGMACASSAHSFGPFFSGIGSRDQS